MNARLWGAACALVLFSTAAWAVDPALTDSDDHILQTYEPITAGFTKDSGDVWYMDATLSLKVRLLPPELLDPIHSRLFLAFTTRFGFYMGTRASSPVIGKSYNPKLIWRYMPDDNVRHSVQGNQVMPGGPAGESQEHAQYIDFAYAHESNGQTINSAEEYAREQQTEERPEFANDYISRGWDYLEVVWKRAYFARASSADADGAARAAPFATYLDLQYFLPRGVLQGKAEEYNTWEMDAQGKPRKAVDGITAILEYQSHWQWGRYLPSNPSFWLKYKTGYDAPFEFSTVRGEAGVEIAGLPVVLWAQHGYMASLANYYRKTTSFGIELRFGEF